MTRPTQRSARAAAAALLLLAAAMPAAAHKTQAFGRYKLTVGWADEPAFTGLRNFIVVAVTDAAGAPVADAAGPLLVEVAFGSERIVLPLEPDAEHRGHFKAALLPTRPGTYALHVTGKVKDQAVDLNVTCSDTTFHCVTDPAAIQFPSKDPSAGELADRFNRSLPRAERAVTTAARAQALAMAAVAVGVVGFVIGVIGLRKGARRTQI